MSVVANLTRIIVKQNTVLLDYLIHDERCLSLGNVSKAVFMRRDNVYCKFEKLWEYTKWEH